MNSNKRIFTIFLSLALVLALYTATTAAEIHLSNGQKCFFGDTYTISLLGTRKAGNDELRSFAKQIEALRKVEKVMRSWGVDVERKVHIRFYTDTDFPARDIWLTAGINPTPERLDKYEEDVGMVFTSLSGYEYAQMADKLDEDYFFLNLFPDRVYRKFFVNPKQLTGDLLNSALGAVKKERVEIEQNLAKPMSLQLGKYVIFDSAAYSSDRSVLWVPVTKPDALHRYLDTTIHEYGHHIFNCITREVLNKNNPKKKWTGIQIFVASGNLLAVNEFFADYVAVANGYNKCINMHKYGALPKDMKRVFSQERTLKGYLDQIARGDKKTRYLLSESHNSLNPMRSFVWKLRLAIGALPVDKIVAAATREAIYNYFAVDMPKYPRVRMTDRGWGCFTVKGYPVDVETENMRYLKLLQKAADKQFNTQQKEKFAEIAGKIFAGYFPLK
ncbi:MAG: hypothetical protein ACOYXC_22210 [Candidatus Rifleibacteriota bacterium]